MAALIDEGLATSTREYHEALVHQVAFRHAVKRSLTDVDALVVPSTPGPAPADLSTTGDPRFNAPWSHAGVPTASIPCALTASGLPVSLQLIGRPWEEPGLLDAAHWCERELAFAAIPPLLAERTQAG
jgi:Asp-tRNA(Asn)/Glu-tRNA(Gln) amidotransferase A subunit family amidase